MTTIERLPVHPVPPDVLAAQSYGSLRIEGLVARPGVLPAETLAGLPRTTVEEPFACEEGWTVPGLRWSGIRLIDVLALGEPLPEAASVRVCSGEFVFPVALAEATGALLCDRLDGAPLPLEHGAPWRLVVPGARCFSSVKWVERLEVTNVLGGSTAEEIARARLAQPS